MNKRWVQIVLMLKRLVYGRKGEPYRIGRHTLRYLPGTRPVRLCYRSSEDVVARYDALQVQLLSEYVREGDTVIDIGAHCGQYALIMAALCGASGTVIAFEPDPWARMQLLKNLDLNWNVKRPVVEPYACSDSTGEAMLFSRRGNSQSSLSRSGLGLSDPDAVEEYRVSLVTLDGYIAGNNLAQPSWVKIDAEGAEIRILKGASNLLQGDSRIICELHPYAWEEFGSTLDELKILAAQSNRRIRYLDQLNEIGNSAAYGTVVIERVQTGLSAH